MQYNIGIGITTRNRVDSFNLTYKNIKKHLPKGSKLIVVDDASDIPVQEADFRFEKNVGIAKAKNKCLELLEDCDFIFLFDSDCYPIVDDWHLKYIQTYEQTGCNHFSFTFSHLADGRPNGNKEATDCGNIVSYHNACGCMLFYTKKCLQIAGGFDEEFGQYGYEHTELSSRIFNLGLSPYRFCDIHDSLKLFHSQDYYREVTTTIKAKQPRLKKNAEIYKKKMHSKKYVPYKQPNNIIITSYFTGISDPQRQDNWEADVSKITRLIYSLKGLKLIVLNDCFDGEEFKDVEFVKINATENPYFQRWISVIDYLENNKVDNVWCVDATDVISLNNPFKSDLKDYLYVGDEKQVVKNKWLIENHKIEDEDYLSFLEYHKNKTLLNAGIVGGKSETVLSFLKELIKSYKKTKGEMLTDMALFNYVAYTKFSNILKHGSYVNTEFKKFDVRNTTPLWRHK